MEALLRTRCFRPLICISVSLGLGAAVSIKHTVEADSDESKGVEAVFAELGVKDDGHVTDNGIYVASRKLAVAAEDSPPKKIEQPAFMRREIDHDADPLEGENKHLRDDDEEMPAALAEAEALSVANLDEGFVWWDRRRRRRRYNCVWNGWQAWKACTVSCGAGQRQRDRITDGPHWGGTVCAGERAEYETCNLQGCAVECNWAHWGPWGPCSKTCGSGLQIRSRGVLPYTDIDGGKECDDAQRKSSQACNAFGCPAPCGFGQWSLWGGCSATCGAGLKRRTRDQIGPAHGGSPCLNAPFLEEKCNNFMCPVDCSWGDWGGWGICSRTCGGGIRLRERIYTNQMENGGVHCPGSPAEVLACNLEDCPVDCKWAPWHDPGPCTDTCGGGSFTRHRPKIQYESFGGVPCTGPNTEIGPCNVEPCAVDCQYGEWAPFNECSASCGGGVHQTTRIGTDPFHGGLDCAEQEKSKEEACNSMPCPAMEVKAAAWQQSHFHITVLLLVATAPFLLQRGL